MATTLQRIQAQGFLQRIAKVTVPVVNGAAAGTFVLPAGSVIRAIDRDTPTAIPGTPTEMGAYALALAAMEHTRGLVAVSRAETRTGADYYLDVPDAEVVDLETSVRLEVSGTDTGDEKVVSARLAQKLKQATAGASNLPAIACVVGFAALSIAAADAP